MAGESEEGGAERVGWESTCERFSSNHAALQVHGIVLQYRPRAHPKSAYRTERAPIAQGAPRIHLSEWKEVKVPQLAIFDTDRSASQFEISPRKPGKTKENTPV